MCILINQFFYLFILPVIDINTSSNDECENPQLFILFERSYYSSLFYSFSIIFINLVNSFSFEELENIK